MHTTRSILTSRLKTGLNSRVTAVMEVNGVMKEKENLLTFLLKITIL